MKPAVSFLAVAGVAVCSSACRDVDRFSTAEGEAYCGNIVSASFVRSSGFVPSARMRLSLDTTQLSTNPGVLSTDDADPETGAGICAPDSTFVDSKLRTVEEVFHDPISTLDFGDGREHNFIAWADTTCASQMLVIVSLMQNDDVEVRLMAPFRAREDGESRAEFAVFSLARKNGDCGF